jgi:hypothetical protein
MWNFIELWRADGVLYAEAKLINATIKDLQNESCHSCWRFALSY